MIQFNLEVVQDFLCIQLPDSWRKETNTSFANIIPDLISKSQKNYVLDFSKTLVLDIDNIGSLITFTNSAKKENKNVYSIGVSQFIQMKIKSHRFNTHFVFFKDLQAINSSANTEQKKPLFDVRIINPFIQAALSTLEMQCNLKITNKPLYIKNKEDSPNVEIAGVISLICDQFQGSTSLCFSSEVFLNIYESMVGERHKTINQEIQDAASELMNIIYGIAKTNLNETLKTDLKPAIPTLLIGENIRIHQKSKTPIVIVPFESSAGAFHIEISTDTAENKTKAAS